jgi:hypothetical protein
MSNRYKGGIISATPPTTNGPFEDGAASGAWTLEQQMQAAAAGTWPLAGNVGPDAFIENLFQTWLYTGNGSTQTITNGIDLAGKGGLVWIKSRSSATNHALADSTMNLASYQCLISNGTNALAGNGDLNSFNSNGFSLGFFAGSGNANGTTYASWTFRKQPKFFDVVTWSGTSSGSSTRAIPHNLGSTPGFIVVKVLNATSDWVCYHRSLGSDTIRLNATSAASSVGDWGTIDSSVFTVTNAGNGLNFLGQNYVAYLFAHDAGGFGLTGTDNVISCGSYTGTGSPQTVNLGYEPQWVLIKRTSSTGQWILQDVMRGMSETETSYLFPNLSDAETTTAGSPPPMTAVANGFRVNGGASWNGAGEPYIYIAIRRGPMKVPTDGTSVFAPVTATQPITSSSQPPNPGFTTDLMYYKRRNGDAGWLTSNRLAGGNHMFFNSTTDESDSENIAWDVQTGWRVISSLEGVSNSYSFGYFRRAPGFFDEVCYTGNNVSGRTIKHNLSVAPELIITKSRNTAGTSWWTFCNFASSSFTRVRLNTTNASDEPSYTISAGFVSEPTATELPLSAGTATNGSGYTYVAYLFASAPGVSKVGSYTGTGTTQVINCGFTAGSRFVLIKRTDASGDWYVWDSARGIVAGDDPYLLLNSTAAEVTNTDYVDTAATGFEISSTAPAAINANGGTFVFLAIA